LSMFVFGGFWASKVKVGIEMTDLTAKNAISDQYWEASQKYFINKDEGYFETRLYYHDLDVSDPNVREQMLRFRYDMLALGSDEYPETRSFLEDLNVFLMEKEQNGMNWMSNVSFSDELDMFFSVKEYRLLYGDAVIRKRKDDDISRYGEIDRLVERLIIGIDLDDTNDEVQFLNEQRRVTLEQPLNENLSDGVERMFLYNDYFDLWEHFRMVPRELIMSLILSLVAVALVCSMFLPHVSGTVLSIVSVVFVDVELVGIIVLAGYTINSITMVLLIMSIGLVADYCLHVVHAYFHINADVGDDGIESTEKKKMAMKRDTVVEEGSACIEDSMVEMSNDERVILSLEKIGGSVFLGGFTTFLGILALAFSSGEAFFSFFVVFVSMVVLGLAHGLIFMPVVLSLVVIRNGESKEKGSNGDVEKKKKKKIVSLFPAIVSSSSSLRNDRQRQKEGEGLFKSGCVVDDDADNNGMNAGDDGLAPMNEETEKIIDASGGDSMGDGLLLCEKVSDR